MTREKLANEIRHYWWQHNEDNGNALPFEFFESMPDEHFINQHLKCECCNELILDELQIIESISMAEDLKHWDKIVSVMNVETGGTAHNTKEEIRRN